MAGKHRSSSMLVLPSFCDIESNYSYGFYHRCWDFVMELETLASASPAVLKFERPEGLEGVAQPQSALAPMYIRFYRMWSKYLQGAVPAMGIGMKTNIVPDLVSAREAQPLSDIRELGSSSPE